MATVKLTSTIASTDLTSDNLSSVVLKSATVTQGGIVRDNIIAVKGGPATLIAHSEHSAGAYVYLKNAGSLNLSFKMTAGAGDHDIHLLPGSWGLFPWAANTNDITVYAAAADGCLVEYAVFE